jgi:septum formation protein
MPRIILASASPARGWLLRQIGISFRVIPSRILEPKISATKETQIQDLALMKARHIASKIKRGLVIGADTIVVHRRRIVGKPRNCIEAKKILKRLNGGTHSVLTGIAVVDAETGREAVGCVRTSVKMKRLTEKEIDAYVASREPLGKAGAYAVQGKGALLIERINGCYYNIVGLPLPKLADMLKKFHVSLIQCSSAPVTNA